MKQYSRFIGVFILIVILVKVDFQKVITHISSLNLVSFVFINFLILPGIFLKSFRWRYILHLQGIDYSIKSSFISYLSGICAGVVTPGRVGELVKVMYLKEDKNIPASEGLASVILDRFFDLYILIILGWAGFFYFLNFENIRLELIFLFSFFLFIVPFLLLNKPLLEKTTKAVYKSLIARLDNKFFEDQFKTFFRAMKKIIMQHIYVPSLLTIGVYLLHFLQCYLLAHLASIEISYLTIVFFISISNLVSLLPVTILGAGTREASLIYLFSLIGLSAEKAIVFSFLLFFSFYVVTGLLSFIGWFGRKNYPKTNQ